jgi:hypothetical protein
MKVSKALLSAMFFYRHVSILQLMERSMKTLDLFLLSLLNQISKNVKNLIL